MKITFAIVVALSWLAAAPFARAACNGDGICGSEEACTAGSDMCLGDCGRCRTGCPRDYEWSCSGGPDAFGGCVRTHVCSYATIDGCCCASSYVDPFSAQITCLSCVPPDRIYTPPPDSSCRAAVCTLPTSTCDDACASSDPAEFETCCDDGDPSTVDGCDASTLRCTNFPFDSGARDIPCDNCDLDGVVVITVRGGSGRVRFGGGADIEGNGGVCQEDTCVYRVPPGMPVTFEAEAFMCGEGVSVRWGGACAGSTGARCDITAMTGDDALVTAEATFQ